LLGVVAICGVLWGLWFFHRRRVALGAERLRKSEEKYRLLVEHASDGIFVAQDGRFEFGNPKALELVGYDAKTLRGRSFADLIHPEERAMVVERHFQRLKNENPPESYPFRILRQDGSVRWVNLKTVRIDWKGRPATLNLLEDFTEKKQAQDALEESEAMYRSLIERANDAVVVVQDQTIVLCNPVFCDWVGAGEGEICGRGFRDFMREKDASAVLAREGEPGRGLGEMVFSGVDGRVRDVEVNAGPISFRGGAATLAILRDITERKAIETVLRNKSVELDQILHALPDALIYTDPERRILRVNPAFTRIFGFASDEVAGRTTCFLYPDEESFVEQGRLRYNEQVGYVVDFYEGVGRRKDGSEFVGEVTAAPVRDADGRVVGLLALVRDVSERREAEERIALLEKQFFMSQKLEAVGRLAGGVAHDFNNVLTVVTLYVDMLAEQLLKTDPLHGKVEIIQEACARAARLTRQLLTFSRRQILRFEILDLNELIGNLMSMLRPLVGENIAVHFAAGEELERVNADPGQIEQVIMNLVVNARDAMPDGGVIMIETRNVEFDAAYAASHAAVRQGAYVMLAVSDTGCGIQKELLGQIFEPFFTTKEARFGTGLGLSTSYGIVKQCGGNIWAYSEAGRGSTFKVYLPQADGIQTPAKKEARELEFYGSGMVLVAEDEEWLLELIVYMLEVAGYKVLTAGSGEEALRVAEECGQSIDLLLTDVIMPGINGWETAERFKERYPDAKVMFMSGYNDEIVFGSRGAEEVSFLSKPFTAAELARKMKEVMSG